MDNLNKSNPGDKDLGKPVSRISREPTSLDEDVNKPIPFDDNNEVKATQLPSSSSGGGTVKGPPVAAASQQMKPVVKKPEVKTVSADRITGVKTFLAKLHLGSIDFIDQQINEWLKGNPGVTIKHTNTATGMVIGKTTEPHIIVTVWY